MAQSEKGLVSLLRQAFAGFNPDDAQDRSLPIQLGAGAAHATFHDARLAGNGEEGATTVLSGWQAETKMPTDRFAKYAILQDMATDPILSASLDMHISHALSADSRTGQILTIEGRTPEDAEFAARLMADLGEQINQGAPGWCKLMAVYGVHFIRPYAEPGKGITNIESGYYTMAPHIREYVRGGETAGFTSEHFKDVASNNQIRLANPWDLVAVKIPYWQPNINVPPQVSGAKPYSLYDDVFQRTPMETQNYGTSMLEFAYGPWCDLNEAIRSLKGSRYNASKIDRFIALGMDNLDPARAAQFLNMVGTQLRKDLETAERKARQQGIIPSVMNRLIPNLANNKGGVTIDTQFTGPDIQYIEDVMFHLRRMSSSLGIDVTMLGWGDLMSGGLGDGGFFRTSIQAAMRANWLRHGLTAGVNRLVDIHMAHKYGKVFAAGETRPIEVRYHALNTAIEAEEAEAMESRTNYATALASMLDVIENGNLANSETFKDMVLTDIIKLPQEKTKKIIAELAKAAKEAADEQDAGGGFMESVGYRGPADGFESHLQTLIHREITALVGE